MSENILGKNIQFMRKLYGETLDELGDVLKLARNTVKGYESGRSEPNLETLVELSKHYGRTVDEMLNVKLYELEGIDSKRIVDMDEMLGVFLHQLPLVESKEANENGYFLKGMLVVKEMLNSFYSGEDVKGTVITDATDFFGEALKEEIYEAGANMLWCIFFLWTQQYTDLKSLQKLKKRLYLKQVDWKEMIYEIKKDEKKSTNKKHAFIADFDETINGLIGILKSMNQWANLGDFYLALRYRLGMIDTGCSNEMNKAVGTQMMISYALLGNQYALDFLKIDVDKNIS